MHAECHNDFDLSVEGPLFGDKVRGRLLLLSNRKAGQYTASDGGTLGDENTQSITGTLYATPSENFWVRLRGHYQEDDDTSAALGYIKARPCAGPSAYPVGERRRGDIAPTRAGIAASPRRLETRVLLDANTVLSASAIGPQISNTLGDPFLSKGPTLDHMGMRRDTFRLAAQAGYRFSNDWTLDFNSGYNNRLGLSLGFDRAAVLNFQNASPFLSSDMTVDMRLSTDPKKRVRGLIGASYFRSTVRISQIDLNAIFGATQYVLNLGNYVNNRSHVPAVYGSVDWDILDTLTLSGDVRYQEDEITTVIRIGGGDIKNKTEQTLPRVTISWKPDRDVELLRPMPRACSPLTLNRILVKAAPPAQMSQAMPWHHRVLDPAQADQRRDRPEAEPVRRSPAGTRAVRLEWKNPAAAPLNPASSPMDRPASRTRRRTAVRRGEAPSRSPTMPACRASS